MSALRKTPLSVLILTALICVAFPPGRAAAADEGRRSVFSHAKHLEEGAECGDCHKTAALEKPLPDEKACAACHDEARLGTYSYPRYRGLSISFKHVLHAGSMACGECHEAVKSDAITVGEPVLKAEDCSSCHEKKNVGISMKSCRTCHDADKNLEKPADHETGWRKRHGPASGWRVFEEHGKDCNLCHQKETCRQCHNDEKPIDHNGLWRLRSHGKAAEWDRDRCKTCHETGTCIQCHRDTRPLNHTGAWSSVHGGAADSGGSESCRACHAPAWCASCHKSR